MPKPFEVIVGQRIRLRDNVGIVQVSAVQTDTRISWIEGDVPRFVVYAADEEIEVIPDAG